MQKNLTVQPNKRQQNSGEWRQLALTWSTAPQPDKPKPTRCQACGGHLIAWIVTRYECIQCGEVQTS